ncbi:hypothetical protein [Aquimarina sp. 2201CG14-23]|uniref:hypothetical protein n=1 Tax=Aquimarina mycalae TaxID=3040073 RepID=UPI0024780CC6|nr:hypothetical protein [Aquimarina sp. 2201CG14-23]MDH7446845.1 hypothetical protein [Aquimarina sp. 2201CG14-23]
MINKLSVLLLLVLFSISCSEGDIIDISVDLNGDLQHCSNENDNTFVFFTIESETNRSLSVNFSSSSFIITPTTVADISITEPTIITLNTTSNQFLYREFDTMINGSEYFCSSIPPSNVNVTQELVSSNGTAEITYVLTDDTSPTETIYARTVTLKGVTLEGNGIAIRREILELGSDNISIPK